MVDGGGPLRCDAHDLRGLRLGVLFYVDQPVELLLALGQGSNEVPQALDHGGHIVLGLLAGTSHHRVAVQGVAAIVLPAPINRKIPALVPVWEVGLGAFGMIGIRPPCFDVAPLSLSHGPAGLFQVLVYSAVVGAVKLVDDVDGDAGLLVGSDDDIARCAVVNVVGLLGNIDFPEIDVD